MYEPDEQFVLRCGQCNKPFDKQSTLKRHGYYCRSRKAGPTPRSRSCNSCARRKARCDNRQPQCSRCISKSIECHYPTDSPKHTGLRIQRNGDATTGQQRTAPLPGFTSPIVENHLGTTNDGGILFDNALVISDPDFTSLGAEYLNWNALDIDLADALNPQKNDETAQYSSFGRSSSARLSTPSIGETGQVQPPISNPSISIPPVPTTTLRIFNIRPRVKTGPQKIADLMMHTLKSYPVMMLRNNTLPPFIHPHLISSEFEDHPMESLTNCISLVHMISSGVKGSRKLFWKNVTVECERLCAEHRKLDKWELIASMQALAIYILVRLHEGERDYNNFDSLLITAVMAICQQLIYIYNQSETPSTARKYDPERSWKDWVFEESRIRLYLDPLKKQEVKAIILTQNKRIGMIYRVVNMLIYLEPITLCRLQPDLILAPLPGKKQLWEAEDEHTWNVKKEGEPGTQVDFALAANGEVVKLDGRQVYWTDAMLSYKPPDGRTSPRSNGHWEEWYSGVDGIGGLVMLAASLMA